MRLCPSCHSATHCPLALFEQVHLGGECEACHASVIGLIACRSVDLTRRHPAPM